MGDRTGSVGRRRGGAGGLVQSVGRPGGGTIVQSVLAGFGADRKCTFSLGIFFWGGGSKSVKGGKMAKIVRRTPLHTFSVFGQK